MGTGVRARNGKIQISFNYQGKRFRETIALEPSPANLKKVDEFRSLIIASIKAGTFEYWVTFPNSKHANTFRPAEPLTVKKYLENWLDFKEKTLKASTYHSYQKIVRGHLIPAFGKIYLKELTKKMIKDWAFTLDVSSKTKMNIVSPLRAALKDAEDDDLINQNPIANWKIKGSDKHIRKDPIDPFTPEEMDLILNQLSGQAKNLVAFILWTGVRTSEACALNWDDIDFVEKKIRINKALTQAAKTPESPKTLAGDRWINMLEPARKALLAQKKHTIAKGEEVFQNPNTNQRWQGDGPIRKTMWQPAVKKANVRYRYPYQLRHTFATNMLHAEENIRWISKQLGHTDWTFTARTYTRYMPSEYQNAGQKAVEKLTGKSVLNL